MKKELILLREEMQKHNVDAYLIPTDDFHGSEYVGEYFKGRRFVSGFTGSAGSLLVMKDMAGLWTDGRYFLQAANQLAGSGITLFKMGEEGVPSIPEFLKDNLTSGMTLGFDGRCIMSDQSEKYFKIVKENGAQIQTAYDLVDAIWADRPEISAEPAWILEEKYSGESCTSKIRRIRQAMEAEAASVHVLASLDDICWILNVRGNDVESTPVVLSYLLMTQENVTWYVHDKCLDQTMRDYLAKNHITIKEYDDIYKDLQELSQEESILYQPSKTNTALVSMIPAGVKRICKNNPSEYMKAVKNPVEVENERMAHIKDGVVMAKFIYYLKTQAVAAGETEVSLGDMLARLRQDQEGYVEESFSPIVGYEENGAIVHYDARKGENRKVEGHGLLLVDTGGHYLEGSTDITRTIAMGPLSQEQKELYTAVLRSHINLSAARFLQGCNGKNLDILARTPLWDLGYNYNHGTGHGVGYLLNVHEGPNSFRYKAMPTGDHDCELVEGMITSDEPGVYLEGKFGIRLENLVVCRKDEAYDAYLRLEPLTLVAFEREAILPELLTEKEIKWLNAYHEKVYGAISPALNDEEKAWLREVTLPM